MRIKKIKDCTCEEINCQMCPFYWTKTQDSMGHIYYNREQFNLCVSFPRKWTIQQAYNYYLKRGKVSGEVVKKYHLLSGKTTIINEEEKYE